MPLDRRSFLASAASLAASAALGRSTPAGAEPPQASGRDDPLGVRGDFPITETRTYLNSAYIAPTPRQVVDEGRAFMERRAAEPLNVGALLRQVGQSRAKFARLINAMPEEVALLYTTTEGENIVANAISWRRGDNVVIDDLHYEAAFVLYRQLEARLGVELRIARNRDGAVEARDYEPLVDARTRLVSVAWVSSVNGFRHDLRAIAEVAHAHGALVYADAIQAVGMVPIDVQAAGVDALCCGTYKWLLAGFGVAPFYVRRSVLDRIRPDRFGAFSVERELPDWHYELREKTAGKFTYATLPFAEVYQLGAALDYLERVGVARIEAHTVGLAARLQEGLRAQGFRVLTPPGNRSSIVTFAVEGEARTLGDALVKASIDATVREREMRVSMALFNTEEEIDRMLEVTKGR
jgi:selenocysteine lyase/cysteine desulfurase